MVRPVRVRSAGGALALSGKDGADGCAMFGLRRAHGDRDARRGGADGRARNYRWLLHHSHRRAGAGPRLQVSEHEPLPVGRARAPLVRVQAILFGEPQAAVVLAGTLWQRDDAQSRSRGLHLVVYRVALSPGSAKMNFQGLGVFASYLDGRVISHGHFR